VGVEFEVEAGFIATIQAGGSYEYSQGVTKESSRTTSWGTGFELGGGVAGFPLTMNGQNVRWPGQCQYGFQPYYYWVDDASSYGYNQSYLVLDYIVPGDRNNSFDLDRMKDLAPCRNGTYKTGANTAPDANDDGALTAPNTKITINVLANDTDPDGDTLSVSAVTQGTNGTVEANGTTATYTPNPGFYGTDSFTYTAADGHGGTASATVNVTVTDSALPDIYGRITNSSGIGGVTVTLTRKSGSRWVAAGTTTTNAQGYYTFSRLALATYRVTPSSTGWIFTPSYRQITISNSNDHKQANFTATAR